MDVTGEKVKSTDYTKEQFQIDLKRLEKAPSEKDRVVIVKSIASNYLLSAEYAAKFVHIPTNWNNIIALAALLMYNLKDGEYEEFAQLVLKNCKYEEDKKQMAMFLETEYKPPEDKPPPKGPKINTWDESTDRTWRL
mmetsp:Transcript_6383/g.7309  ORF Transcript_6383/g.7309 Transcript_6383/m.7309 type:complete len:137 (-) Transcript_6383:480-890(-)|eukprot:CAMPEP_0184009882 /NCGR_PEP_ID=MMETSP0954-20121128/2873_1 /TAXON_ID=627963 /ORGANISM="Aplanochytrium sp, Strain PBS07" /LENGTH=136 /DNA_ID=CAMNT_0026289347 /DNA_START=142 /DNA_END=552 /DNA_ORIENTATION=+